MDITTLYVLSYYSRFHLECRSFGVVSLNWILIHSEYEHDNTLRTFLLQPISFRVSFIWSSIIQLDSHSFGVWTCQYSTFFPITANWIWSVVHLECHSFGVSFNWSIIHLKYQRDNTLRTFLLQPFVFGVSFISSVIHLEYHSIEVSSVCSTAYCIWSVIKFRSPISIFLVSFQRNVIKET